MRITSMIFILILLFSITSFGKESNASNNIDISTSPHKVLFDLRNMKPGDSVTRELLIENHGEESLDYILKNKFTGGLKLFYNQLKLVIEDTQGIIYEGKLQEFSGLVARSLINGEKENLMFHIKIPMDLTNEYQGATADFQFNIFVKGTLGGMIPVDNRLPDTAANVFNFIMVGSFLIVAGISLFTFKPLKLRPY